MNKADYSKISPELRAKLLELDKERPENQSLQVLQDIALILQDIVMTDDEKRKSSNETIEEFGALLTDARESLQKIADKKDPESPDFSKPVVEVLNKLITAVNSKEYSPKIDVKVPDINVPTPQVNVDVSAPNLSGMEKLLKTEVPKAFEEAISKIPETVIPEYPDRWDEVMGWLESIDTASRMKPVFPTELKIKNPDGTDIGHSLLAERYDIQGTTIYSGEAPVGTLRTSIGWTITKYDLADVTDASGLIATDVSWDDRASGSYA